MSIVKLHFSEQVDYCNITSFMCTKEFPNLNIRIYKNATHKELYSFSFCILFVVQKRN